MIEAIYTTGTEIMLVKCNEGSSFEPWYRVDKREQLQNGYILYFSVNGRKFQKTVKSEQMMAVNATKLINLYNDKQRPNEISDILVSALITAQITGLL